MSSVRDVVALFLPHLDVSGGLGVHCRMLLAALNTVPTNRRFVILAPNQPNQLFPTTASEPFDVNTVDATRFEFRRIAIPNGFSLAMPLDGVLMEPLATIKPQLLYCSYYTGMASPPCPQIVAFHDAGFLENPAGFGETAVIRKRTIDAIRPAIKLIQCISNDARDRICRHLPWHASKTAVIWHTLPDSPKDIATALQSLSGVVSAPYFFLPVGAATGFNRVRKNVPTAVIAFRSLAIPHVKLIIAGTATLTPNVLAELIPPTETGSVFNGIWHSTDNAVVIYPTLERSEFLATMRHAAAVIYPSRYEGFGLPTLEAMALGVPLIAANATSIPEIVGDAGFLIMPDDVTGFAKAMQSALTDPAAMKQLIEAGRQRMKLFTLDRMGLAMNAMFDAVGGHRAAE